MRSKLESAWYDPSDPVLSIQNRGQDRFAEYRNKYINVRKMYGSDLMSYWRNQNDEDDFDPTEGPVEGEEYTNWQLERMTDELLRSDARRELCRKCGRHGEETGEVEAMPQADPEGNPVIDGDGNTLYVEFPELTCDNGHRWYKGEGKARGIGGRNPILFENHLQDRRRREIYTAVGVPDPSINRGLYNRTHPQGRKVNSPEQRAKNGASWYK